jgi:thermitase
MLGFFLITTLLLSFQTASAARTDDELEKTGPPASSPPGSDEFVPGEVLVKFKRDASLPKMQTTLLAQNARAVGEIPALGVQRLSVPEGQELTVITALQQNSLVEYAEPNYIIRAVLTPNDTYFLSHQWNMPQINAPQAWDITTGSSDLIIAIVDSGIDLDHPDLSGKIILGYDYVNEDWDPDDDYGHGTHVAGIAAAWTNNGQGVAGVSWGAQLMALKVLNAGGTGNHADVASAVTYATDNGAKIINLSLGGDFNDQTLRNAVVYAHNAGCVVVAATGNDNGPVLYPAKYTEAFAVAATDSSDQRYWLSNYGPEVDVAAPGVSIYSTYFTGGYTYMTGTSMAAPHVAGLAALIWSACPGYTSAQVESRIETTAVDLGPSGWDQYYGHGRIDAHAALLCAANLGASPQSVVFLADDDTDPIPSSQTVGVLNTGCEPITWTVTISPPSATWLTAIPLSGTATTTSPGSISLSASKSGLGHGTYNAQVVISTTQTTAWGNPQVVDVKLTYMAELYKLILVSIFKNYSQ